VPPRIPAGRTAKSKSLLEVMSKGRKVACRNSHDFVLRQPY
jgi:hypothetical protein